MKISKLEERLQPDRPMTTITIRMPEDVIRDLKRIAPQLGFSGYQPLIRAYVGQGLRADLARLDPGPEIAALVESLRKRGGDEQVLASALEEMKVVA